MNNWRQISGIAGILFVVVFIIGGILTGDTPMFTDSGEEIAAWFADNGDTYLVGDFISGLGFIFLYFPFLAGLYAVLRAAEGGEPFWSRISLAGGILFPAAGLVGGVPLAALALLEGDVSPEAASMAAATSYHSFAALAAILAILVGSASIVILTRSLFWNWLGWLGAIIAVIGVIGSASSIEKDPEGVLAILGFIAFIGFGVWILAVSVGLLRSGERTVAGAI